MHRILVIDDEKQIRDFVFQALSRFGFDVETASSGKEGIRKFGNETFDLVLTDILMPEIDGNGVAKHIRNSDRPGTPIIGISGMPWLLENNHFDMVFAKPFSLKDLVSAVRDLSSHSQGPVSHT